jgi:hypothetical protein
LEISDLGLDKKDYEGETISYLITDILERFPHPQEEIVFDLPENKKLSIKVLDVND